MLQQFWPTCGEFHTENMDDYFFGNCGVPSSHPGVLLGIHGTETTDRRSVAKPQISRSASVNPSILDVIENFS